MRRVRVVAILLQLAAMLVLVSCGPPSAHDIIFEPPDRQQQLRLLQTHLYEETDRIRVMRAVIVTLQDLDFVITQADSSLGFIGAVKLNGYKLHITVMADALGTDRISVRVSLAAGMMNVPEDAYQAFFASVAKNISLHSP